MLLGKREGHCNGFGLWNWSYVLSFSTGEVGQEVDPQDCFYVNIPRFSAFSPDGKVLGGTPFTAKLMMSSGS